MQLKQGTRSGRGRGCGRGQDADVAGDVQAMDSWCWNQAGCECKLLLLQLYTTSQSQLDRLTDFRQTVRQLYSSIRSLATTSLFSWQSQWTSTQLWSHHHRKMQHMGSMIHLMSTGMRQLLMRWRRLSESTCRWASRCCRSTRTIGLLIRHWTFISKTMSRKRYEKLSQYFHCSIAAEEDPQDKLAKVRPLITLCERNFGHLFGPSKNLCWRGHDSWKQYLPKKPIKWGIKLWCLCDSRTGYCVAFIVYTGAAGNGDVTLDLAYKVVMKLMTKYMLRHHHVYADNYFTSVHLAEDLLQADTHMSGTTRSTRKEFPKTLAYVPQGQSIKWTREDSSVMVCKWHDKRDICMIATNSAGDNEDIPVRRNRQ